MAEKKSKTPIGVADSDAPTTAVIEEGELAPEELQRRIAETAYFLAAARNFIAGDSVQDWLEAEIMVNAALVEERRS
jgi:Protein of unknown function (DUF2934)